MSEMTDERDPETGLSMDTGEKEAELEARIADRVAEQLDRQQSYRGPFGGYRFMRDRGRRAVRARWDHYTRFVAPPDDDDTQHPGVPEVFQGRRGRVLMGMAAVLVLAGWCVLAWALWP